MRLAAVILCFGLLNGFANNAAAAPERCLIENSDLLGGMGGGGMIMGIKLGGACLEPSFDQGRACRKKSDCAEACLAQSQSCSAPPPPSACIPVLDEQGRATTGC